MSCLEALEKPLEVPESLPLVLVVAAALVDSDGRVLLAQRAAGREGAGLWEFPGGKVDPGESPEYALARELGEEIGIEARPCCFLPLTFASHRCERFHLLMPLYVCRMWKGAARARAGEHEALRWLFPREMGALPMPEADIPLVAALRESL